MISRYAANAIVLPSLDMYSNLLPNDASAMIDHLISIIPSTTASNDASNDKSEDHTKVGMAGYRISSPFWAHWRGRYGSTEDEQARIWSMIDPSNPSPAGDRTIEPSRSMNENEADKAKTKKEVSLVFRTFEGEKRTVKAFIGDSLLDVARREDLPSMEGTCEGNLGKSLLTFIPTCLSQSIILMT